MAQKSSIEDEKQGGRRMLCKASRKLKEADEGRIRHAE